MTTIETTCAICVEALNKKTHVPVKCAFCDFAACRKCCETFVLSTPEPKCMNTACGKTWTRGFMIENFTQAFLTKTLREHKERVYLEKEMALFPATQELIERKKEEAILIQDIQTVSNKITGIKHTIDYLTKAKITSKRYENPIIACLLTKRETEAINAIIHRLSSEENTATTLHDGLRNNLNLMRNNTSVARVKKTFIRRCANSECRGFLNTHWNCGLCTRSTCKECHLMKSDTETHECNPDDVATAAVLVRESKPCPTCSTPICKIDGCDQMWCTQCHTAFSWNTGNIETVIHNPHFYEYQRRMGTLARNPLDVPCGRAIDNNFVQFVARNIYDSVYMEDFMAILRVVVHIREVEMPKFATNHVLNNETLRVDYMTQKIDEAKFKSMIYKEHTKFEKKKETHDILAMFVQTVTDIMHRFMKRRPKHVAEKREASYDLNKSSQIKTLVAFTNECLDTLAKTFSNVPFEICIDGSTRAFGFKKKAVAVAAVIDLVGTTA